MLKALYGITLVALQMVAEEKRNKAAEAEKTYSSIEEYTRDLSDYHIFAMYPMGARPYNYFERWQKARNEADAAEDAVARQQQFISALMELDAMESIVRAMPSTPAKAEGAPFAGWCGRPGCIACYMYPSGVLCHRS